MTLLIIPKISVNRLKSVSEQCFLGSVSADPSECSLYDFFCFGAGEDLTHIYKTHAKHTSLIILN